MKSLFLNNNFNNSIIRVNGEDGLVAALDLGYIKIKNVPFDIEQRREILEKKGQQLTDERFLIL